MAEKNISGFRIRGFDSLIMPTPENPVPMPKGAAVPPSKIPHQQESSQKSKVAQSQ
jgi:hypothetical protein